MSNFLRFRGRRLLLAVAIPPVTSVYQAYYRLVIRLAVRLLRRYKGVRAIYLRRGGAIRRPTPWVSDLDFAVLVSRMSPAEEQAMATEYRKWAAKVVIADESLDIFDEAELPRLSKRPAHQYRLLEGKQTWRRLHGEDSLARLPLPPLSGVRGGLCHELKVWWTIFSWQLLQGRPGWDDPVQQNSVCYKVVAEVLKIDRALFQGVLLFDRESALAQARDASDRPFHRRLFDELECARGERYRIRHPGLVESTLEFLLDYFDTFASKLPALACAAPREEITQEFDYAAHERFAHLEERRHAERMGRALRTHCGESAHRIHLLPNACGYLDELSLMVEMTPGAPTRVEQLRQLCRMHLETQHARPSKVHLYLLLPHVALQLDADYIGRGWQSVLCAPLHPEVFGLLNTGLAQESSDGAGSVPSAWSPLAEEFVRDRLGACVTRLNRWQSANLDGAEFVRVFWKTLRLELVLRSAGTRRIVYALTVAAIRRTLAQCGAPVPNSLAELDGAYHMALDGRAPEIGDLRRQAVEYVHELAARRTVEGSTARIHA